MHGVLTGWPPQTFSHDISPVGPHFHVVPVKQACIGGGEGGKGGGEGTAALTTEKKSNARIVRAGKVWRFVRFGAAGALMKAVPFF